MATLTAPLLSELEPTMHSAHIFILAVLGLSLPTSTAEGMPPPRTQAASCDSHRALQRCGGTDGRAHPSAARRFSGRAIGNSPSGGRVSKHSFPVGAGYALNFRDNRRANTPYRLCAWMGGRRQGCGRGRTGRRGRDDVIASYDVYSPQSRGRLIWRWYVGGRRVARWDVTVTIGD